MKFSEKLKVLRMINGHTQKDFADFLGIGLSTLSAYEYGKKKPGLKAISKLADHYPQFILWLIKSDDNIAVNNINPTQHIAGDHNVQINGNHNSVNQLNQNDFNALLKIARKLKK